MCPPDQPSAGRETRMIVSWPSLLFAFIWPRCWRTISRQMLNSMPVPRPLVGPIKLGSKIVARYSAGIGRPLSLISTITSRGVPARETTWIVGDVSLPVWTATASRARSSKLTHRFSNCWALPRMLRQLIAELRFELAANRFNAGVHQRQGALDGLIHRKRAEGLGRWP